MIIGALPYDYASIIDSAPPQFDVCYHDADRAPAIWHCAEIAKRGDGYGYRFRRDAVEVESLAFGTKEGLIARMTSDNLRYNGGGKCTVEF